MKRVPVGLCLLLLAFVGLAIAWHTVIPPYENLDEIEHAEVVRYIADTGRLPVHGEAEDAGYHVRQEASQPPLYHILGAGWVRLWHLPREAPAAEQVPESLVACGSGDTAYKRVTWRRDPYAERHEDGHRRMVSGVRLLSTLLQGFTIVGTWVLARRILGRGPAPLLAAAIVAFNPQFLLVAAGVNNDNLVTPLATWALVLLVGMVMPPARGPHSRTPEARHLIAFGSLAGFASLSKLSGLGLLGLAGVTLLLYAWRRRIPFPRLVTWGLYLGVPALLIVAPWLLRNLSLYGDPTALAPMLAVVGRSEVRADLWGTFLLMLRSYWGQLPCAFYPHSLTWPFYLLLGGGLGGLMLRRKASRDRGTSAAQLVLGGWFAIIVIAWIRWNALTPATGGRLLFPAAPALALIVAAGWQRLHRWTVRAWIVLLPLVAILTLLIGAAPIFAPPIRLGRAATLPNPTDTVFGEESIRLRGYKLGLAEPGPECWPAQSSGCRQALDLTLYLEAPQPLATDWVLAVQLVSARPGDTTLRLTYDAWPGHGNAPTSAWPPGTVLRERLRLPLPERSGATQAWHVQLAFYDLGTGELLPVRVAGQPAGNAARLALLRVQDDKPSCEALTRMDPVANFESAVALTHAAVETTAAGWEVALCWESLASLGADATVFVHAYDADGTLLGTGDGPPVGAAFPTHLWRPGDVVLDVHTLAPSAVPDTVVVGLYYPETGSRLVAQVGDVRQVNDAVIVWRR